MLPFSDRRARAGRCRPPSCRARPAAERAEEPAGAHRSAALGLAQVRRPGRRCATGRAAPSGPRTRACRSGRSASGRSGTSRTSSTSSPGRTRPSTASSSSSPTRAIKAADSGAQDRARRPLRAADRGDLQPQTAAGLLRRRLPRTRCTRRTPGIKSKFHGDRAAPLHRHLQEPDPADRRSPRRAEGQRRRRQGPLDHRAGLELAAPAGGQHASPKGSAGRRRS